MRPTKLGDFVLRTGLALMVVITLGATPARAEDKLLVDTVELTGAVIYLGVKPPAFVIGVVRNGETVVRGREAARSPTATR